MGLDGINPFLWVPYIIMFMAYPSRIIYFLTVHNKKRKTKKKEKEKDKS